MDDEFACVTVAGDPGEGEAAFKARLVAFWSAYLRNNPDDYEKVYAEATRFEAEGGRVTRQYMVEVAGLDALEAALRGHALSAEPADRDDLFTRYEVVEPDWFRIEH